MGRRFERLGEHGGVAVVDDYAHHPSELVGHARRGPAGVSRDGGWWRCSSRTSTRAPPRTAQAMGEALAAADLVVVTEVYAAREQPIDGVSGRQVADAARRAGADALFEPTRAEVGRRVYEALAPGDVVLTLGAGDITRVGPELVRWLGAA